MDPATARDVRQTALNILWPEVEPGPLETLDAESAVMAEARAKAFRLYTRRMSLRQIADELKIHHSTAGRYVNQVLDGYRRYAMQDARAHLAAELGRLATLEAELWEAWDRSKGEAVETFTGKTDRGSSAKVTKKQRHGDPRIMKLLLDAWDKRCRLLGLLAGGDAKSASGTPPVKFVAGINPEELV